MKKLLLAALAGMMILATASIGAAEVTVGGAIVTRYDLWKNLSLNHNANNYESVNFFNSRIMLNVDAKITEGLEAFVELDTATDIWGLRTGTSTNGGTTANLDNIPAYLNSVSFASNRDGVGNEVAIRQAWINFMIPGMPVGVKIGHQPLALGHGIWLDTSRYGSEAILVYSKPIPELLVAGAYVQGSQDTSLQPSMFGAGGRLSGAILDGNNALNTAPTNTVENNAKFYALLANYTWMENNTAGFNVTYVDDRASIPSMDIWATNTALVLDGTIGALTYKGEVDWLYVNTDITRFVGVDHGDYLVNAWAFMLGASYKVMDMATVGMEVAYGTGNDDSRPSIFYNPGNGAVTTPDGWMDRAYYTPYNSGSYNYAFLYNDKIGQGPFGSGGGFGFGDGYGGFGLANTGFAKVSVGLTPTERLKAGLDVLYLRASETMIPGQSRDLGWEVDANVAYKMYDNLTLSLQGGAFLPGNWYRFTGHAPLAGAALATTEDGTATGNLKKTIAWGMEAKVAVKF